MRKAELLPIWDCEAGYASDDQAQLWACCISCISLQLHTAAELKSMIGHLL